MSSDMHFHFMIFIRFTFYYFSVIFFTSRISTGNFATGEMIKINI